MISRPIFAPFRQEKAPKGKIYLLGLFASFWVLLALPYAVSSASSIPPTTSRRLKRFGICSRVYVPPFTRLTHVFTSPLFSVKFILRNISFLYCAMIADTMIVNSATLCSASLSCVRRLLFSASASVISRSANRVPPSYSYLQIKIILLYASPSISTFETLSAERTLSAIGSALSYVFPLRRTVNSVPSFSRILTFWEVVLFVFSPEFSVFLFAIVFITPSFIVFK